MSGFSGATVGLVGALAAFPRRLAARAVEHAGGRLQRGTTRASTHVVFGRTWLTRAGDAVIAARVAAEGRAGRVSCSEDGFLRRLGLLSGGGTGDLSRAALIGRSGLDGDSLDLLALFDGFEHDAEPFGFRDLILAKKYAGLIAGGANWAAIARAVHRSGAAVSLTAKALQVGGRSAIHARDGDRAAELDGQLLLDLADRGDDPEEVFAAAEAAEACGRHDAAAAIYARCLALDPGDAVAAFNRANCLRAAGRQAEAEADYARALRHDPGFLEAWFNLAGLVAERGRPESARRHLERAIAIDAGYADAVFNLAALAFERGDMVAARQGWVRYLDLDPTSDWARTATRGLRFLDLHAAQAAG